MVAPLVQLVERRFPKPDVEGSSPSGRVWNKHKILMYIIHVVGFILK
jgi:hypothetical protein